LKLKDLSESIREETVLCLNPLSGDPKNIPENKKKFYENHHIIHHTIDLA
jgi:hypothetical protein